MGVAARMGRMGCAGLGIGAALVLVAGSSWARADGGRVPQIDALAPHTALATGLDRPRGVAIAANGAVYFTDEQRGLVYEIPAGGAPRVLLQNLKRPRGLAVEDAGHLLLVVERFARHGGPAGALVRVDTASASATVIGSGLRRPRGVTRAADGSIYVTAEGLRRADEAADDDGDDHDRGCHEIGSQAARGSVLRFRDGDFTTVATGFVHPDGIVALADGTLLVAAEGHRAGRSRLTGSVFAVGNGGAVSVRQATPLDQARGLVRDVTGAVFVAGGREGRDGRRDGTILRQAEGGATNSFARRLRRPAGLAIAPDGDLVATDLESGIVWRFAAPPRPALASVSPVFTNLAVFPLRGSAAGSTRVLALAAGVRASTTPAADGSFALNFTLPENVASDIAVVAVGAAGEGLASAAAELRVVQDNLPPIVRASADRPANAAGWHDADVVVSFSCSDSGSGVASCPQAVSLTTEGAQQQVSGVATDRAGNVATAGVVLSLDKTPPSLKAATSPALNAAGWSSVDVTVSFTCQDALSGIASCPAPQVVTAEGAGLRATGEVIDLAGNHAVAGVTVNIDRTPPVLTAVASPAANARGWNKSDVTVSFQASDALSGLDEVSPPEVVTGEGAGLTAFGSATDRAGNQATATFTAHIDRTPPTIAITSPEPGLVRRVPRVSVSGTATDETGLFAVQVDGVDAGDASPWQAEVALDAEGPHSVVARAEDMAGNTTTAAVDVRLAVPPIVRITSPRDLDAVGTAPITVSGSVDDPQATVTVGLERVPATVSGGSFVATGVSLREGGNVITATASDAQGNASSDAVTVVLDTTAPRVLIDSPEAGSLTTEDTIAVSGRINDLVLGTVNSGQARVSVNGVEAEVANRTFVARGVPLLVAGLNALTATAFDAVGNSDSQTVSVMRHPVAGPRVRVVSGDAQSAGIGEMLPEPLRVIVDDGTGRPATGRSVVFRVAENSGELTGAGGSAGRGLSVVTDDDGTASVRLRVGTRAGVGNNRVEVTAPGLMGGAVFTASGRARPADKINVDSGGGQLGVVGQPLPRPFVAVVTDAGHNRLPDVPVTFRVVAGDGSFGGGSETTVVSDGDGRALAVLTLGPRPGVANNVVTASAFGLEDKPAGFSASAHEPGDPSATSLSGVVLDNANVPIAGVTLRIRGTALATATDAQGQFRVARVPLGNVHLQVDGTTARRPGSWPSLEFELVVVPGIDNTLGMPIYLVELDTRSSIFVDETRGGTLTLEEVPGFSLRVLPNSAMFPDGTRRGTISVTPVHVDKVPMVPNFGQQPRFIVTIQPPGVRFDPPAAVTHPNVDGLAPGEITEIYSFDHDMGSFVATGTATVSEDGTALVSDPGMGIVKGGWHCGGNPARPGSAHNCPECQKCSGPACLPDNGAGCDDHDVCTSADGKNAGPDLCDGGSCQGKKIAFPEREAETAQEAKVPDALLAKVHEVLYKVPGFRGIKIDEIKGQVAGKVKDCCGKTTGLTRSGVQESEAAVELKVKVNGLKIFGPPTISRPFNMGPLGTGDFDLEVGAKVEGDFSFAAKGGLRQDECRNESCVFGEVGGSVNTALKVNAKAVVCFKGFWQAEKECGSIEFAPLQLSAPISLKAAMNDSACGAGLKGKFSIGKLKFKISAGFGITDPPTPTSGETKFEGFKISYPPPSFSYEATIVEGFSVDF